MTAPQYLVTAFAATMALACLALLGHAYRRTGELLSPWTLFLGMAFLDIYVPAALFFPVGLELPPWLSLLARDVAMPALMLFTAGAGFFAAGYWKGSDRSRTLTDSPADRLPSRWRALALTAAVVSLYYLALFGDISAAGGVGEYITQRLVNRLAPPVDQAPWVSLVASLRGWLLPIIFVMAGVAFARRHTWGWPGFAVPAIAAVTAATTASRGSLLTLVMGLAVVERARLHDRQAAGEDADGIEARRTNARVLAVCVLGGLLFVGYGTERNYLTEVADLGAEASLSHSAAIEMSRFTRGEGFIGVVAVMDAYPRDVPYMNGRTILDMLLLPVPRAIWTTKPLWYGIDDITRSMGWPESTQSAVTMPGELYANFSGWGLPLMGLYGWLFGLMRSYRFDPIARYVYAFVLVPMMLPTFWMAFTGFVNQLAVVPAIALALWLVFASRSAAPGAAGAVYGAVRT